MAETRPSEMFLNQQGQNQEKVIVNFYDGKQVRGYLSRLDSRDKYFQIQAIEGFERAKILEVGFEEIQSMYFVHDFDQKLPHYRVDSDFWDRAFTKKVSGTVVFKWEEGRWIARFKKSRTDLGGIFFEPQKTGNVRRVFFPFPKKNPL